MKRCCRWLCCVLAVMLLAASLGCIGAGKGDIVILYTNDVHCGVSDDIGYAGLADYKARCERRTPYVTLVDCGDAVQGDLIGVVSYGEYPVDIMNEVGYDFAVLGNHEFDYGMDQLATLIDRADFTYLGCNIDYTGDGENALAAAEPYRIVTYGDTRVAFIGVSTPHSITSSTPSYFMEDGAFVYDFHGGSGDAFYAAVQGYVDACRQAGADYVVLLTHLGDLESLSPYSSVELAEHTTGVDAILDGHAHSVIPERVLANAAGERVLLSSAGTKLHHIGQLVITRSGRVRTRLISKYRGKSEAVSGYIDGIEAAYKEAMNTVVAESDIALSCADSAGVRLVRSRETAIGDLCADAYRAVSGADVALVNGGGIRADLPEGDITFADIIAVHPFGNTLCVVRATGQEICDALETASRFTMAETSENGGAVGESGGFLSVSGLRYTIDASIPSSVTMDENGMFVSVDGARRVSGVEVLNAEGVYEPIDPEGVYTLASHDHLIKGGGDGLNMFADNEFLIDEGMIDYQILISYIKDVLHGRLGDVYAEPERRIFIK